MNLEKEKMLQLYKNMVRSRAYEELLMNLFAENKLAGWAHLGIGQEATGAALAMVARPDDYLSGYHRSRGVMLARGVPLEGLMGEMAGRKIGFCGGIGGESHTMSAEYAILGTGGLVGSGVPIVTGIAYALMLEGKKRVAVCHSGEGSCARGAWHESINMASTWKLPMIFLVENNLYAEFTPLRYQMNIEDVAERAKAYGIPGYVIDGNDPLAAYPVLEEAFKRARAGEGPTLIEAKTYRHSGHFEGDPGAYRPEGELEAWKKRDPIVMFRKKLLDDSLATEEELDAYYTQAASGMNEVVERVFNSPHPTKEDVFQPVFA